jgi:hypothetical protein
MKQIKRKKRKPNHHFSTQCSYLKVREEDKRKGKERKKRKP